MQQHVERLFLLVLLHPATAAAGGSAEAAQGVAFLAMLFSLVWAVSGLLSSFASKVGWGAGTACNAAGQVQLLPQASLCANRLPCPPYAIQTVALCPQSCPARQVRRLALALGRTFHPQHLDELERQLGDEQQWAVDDELLAAAQAVAGLAYA